MAALAGICLLAVAMPCFAYGAVSENALKDVPEPRHTDMESVKEGLVEIQTGLMDNDKFRQVRQGNGFLVSNTDGAVYVVTTRRNIEISEDDRNDAGADDNAAKSIRIVVRGDVVSELSEVASSKKQDFCILQAEDVVKSKGLVTLRADNAVEQGEEIHVLGFPSEDESDTPLQYEVQDVQSQDGDVSGEIKINGAPYIQHTAVVHKSFDGSVLTDKDGFVVGMNDISKTDGDQYYALSIREIEKVLQNYGLPYATVESEAAYAQLYERCKKAIRQDNQKRFKSESKQKLEEEIENSIIVMTESPYDAEALRDADTRLAGAQKELKTKIGKTTWVIILLGAFLIYLLIRFSKLLLWKRKHAEELLFSKENALPTGESEDPVIDENLTEKTTMFENSIELSHNEKINAYYNIALFWNRGGQQIRIEKPEFVIGKKKDSVDFAIEDNRLVSRVHAAIQVSRNECRIIDLNSSNGTYVNEQKVLSGGTILHNGDIIRLANEEFIVEIV